MNVAIVASPHPTPNQIVFVEFAHDGDRVYTLGKLQYVQEAQV